MNIKTLIVFSLLSTIGFSQTVIHWEPEISVSEGALYGNIRPRLALANGITPVVLYGKSSGGKLFSSRWNGTSFSTPISLLPANVDSYLANWTGPDIAANNNTVIAVFKAMPLDGGKVYSVRSTDGGITFSDTIRVDDHQNGIAWMPSMDMDENGNPSVIYMSHDPGMINPRYAVVHSNDAGITYQTEIDVTTNVPQEACDCCPAEYVIDGANHALLFRNNDNNVRDIYSVFSSDDGVTYPLYSNVDNLNWSVNSCPSTGPHGTFNNNKLITTYASRASGSYRVYLSETSITPSIVFENRTMVTPPTNSNGFQNFPRISGKNDTIVMAWQESETSNTEIFSSVTINGAISELISSKTIVNTNTTAAQTNPDIIYSNGYVHIVYTDAFTGNVIYRKGIIGTLGIDQLSNETIKVYPNPSKNGIFTLNFPSLDQQKLELVNSIGTTCKYHVQNTDQGSIIEIENKDAGIYFLKITSENTTTVVKLIQD